MDEELIKRFEDRNKQMEKELGINRTNLSRFNQINKIKYNKNENDKIKK